MRGGWAALGLAMVSAACLSTTPPVVRSEEAATYVGGAACAGCHAEQRAAWRGSQHDLAMQDATPATVKGNFDNATFSYAGVTTTFSKRGGKYIVRTDGPDGALHDYGIAYTFGVEPLQQYLIAFPDGRLQALSICWDTRPAAQGGQRWFHLYPGERVDHQDILHWTGPLQNWNFMCAECHSTNLHKNYDAAKDRFATRWSEIDVSCEACHGPASNHVAWARAGGEDGAAADHGLVYRLGDADGERWVMEAGAAVARRIPPRRTRTELETCARCHSRRSLISEDYVYGKPLLDTHRPALLDEGLYYADGQILGEVYVYGSFLQSRMQAAGVTCTDCHDPHTLHLKAEGNALCGTCHLAARFDTPAHHHHETGTPGARCVDCHMPARPYMVVDPRRDHSFRVPRPDLTVTIGTPNACQGCHADRPAAWAAAKTTEWLGAKVSETRHYGEVIDAGRRGLAQADAALARLAGDSGAPGIVRATALSLLRENPGPSMIPALLRAVTDGEPLVRMAAADVAGMVDPTQRAQLLGPLLDDPVRSVRIAAAMSLVPLPPGGLPEGRRAALDAALAEYRQAQMLNADRAESHLNLGVLYSRTDETGPAETEYRKAIAMLPGFAAPYINLADLFRSQRKEDASEETLRDGLAAVPDDADLYQALGLALIRQKRRKEGLEALRRAHDLAPDDVRHAYVLGIGLNSFGDPDQALRILDEAHRRRPGDRDLLLALATISRDAGRREQALGYARKLAELSPEDAGVRRLLQDLQRR
jgi:Flp pilus assembly protein TadD